MAPLNEEDVVNKLLNSGFSPISDLDKNYIRSSSQLKLFKSMTHQEKDSILNDSYLKNLSLIKKLFEGGLKYTPQKYEDYSLFNKVVATCDTEIVELFLKNGAIGELDRGFYDESNNYYTDTFNFVTDTKNEEESEKYSSLEELLSVLKYIDKTLEGGEISNDFTVNVSLSLASKEKKQIYPLEWAVETHNKSLIKKLFEGGLKYTPIKSKDYSLFNKVVATCDTEIVELFLKNGAIGELDRCFFDDSEDDFFDDSEDDLFENILELVSDKKSDKYLLLENLLKKYNGAVEKFYAQDPVLNKLRMIDKAHKSNNPDRLSDINFLKRGHCNGFSTLFSHYFGKGYIHILKEMLAIIDSVDEASFSPLESSFNQAEKNLSELVHTATNSDNEVLDDEIDDLIQDRLIELILARDFWGWDIKLNTASNTQETKGG